MSRWTRVSGDALDLWSLGKRQYLVALDYVWEGRTDVIDLPIVVICGGDGDRVLVSGGTHGDEYEGMFVAAGLARSLESDAVSGSLIIVPRLNPPACLAGTRRSPIDGLDINRVFPGENRAGPSHAIARFVAGTLIAAVDTVFDIHSGGTATEFVLSANLQGQVGDLSATSDLAGLIACDAPYAIVFDEVGDLAMPHRGTLEGSARAAGKRAYSSEFGGGGRMSLRSVTVADACVRNFLAHERVLRVARQAVARGSQLIALHRPEQHVAAPANGHFLPHVELGGDVVKGQLLGQLFMTNRRGCRAAQVRANCPGVVVGIASLGMQPEGGCLFYVGERISHTV